MPDEDFEELWRLKGGPEMVALHAMFAGAEIPADEIRSTLGLDAEQLRSVCRVAERVGLVESGDESVGFPAFLPGSSGRDRLDWCLEGHKEEFDKLVGHLRSRLLLRYLDSPPGREAA